jgi:acyl-CoA thioesterase I
MPLFPSFQRPDNLKPYSVAGHGFNLLQRRAALIMSMLLMAFFGLGAGMPWQAALAQDSAPNASSEKPLKIMLYGDSILAGYGLPKDEAFAGQLERQLEARGQKVEIINASVSGDTTAGGVSRLDWALGDRPDLVILALGGNDILRAIDPANTRGNLATMLERLNEEQVPVLLAGMMAPASLGPEYRAAFDPIYPDLARKYADGFYPFLLDGVATDPALNQNDGIHPNGEGVKRMIEGMLPVIEDTLERIRANTKS